MENKDILDIFAVFDSDIMDAIPLNVGDGEYGQPIDFNCTEEGVGSKPCRFTYLTY
jgi:hypothetical protein